MTDHDTAPMSREERDANATAGSTASANRASARWPSGSARSMRPNSCWRERARPSRNSTMSSRKKCGRGHTGRKHPRRQRRASPASVTAAWASYVDRQLDSRQRAMMKAIARVLIEQEHARERLPASW